MTQLVGKNVLITGAASGIGRHMVMKMAPEGAHLILWDVNLEGLEKLSKELKEEGHKVSIYQCNLSERSSIYSLANQVLQEVGAVDVLINNAGIVSGKKLLETTDEEIMHTFEINTLALFWTTRAFLPAMIQNNRGHIVTMVSAGGLVGIAKLTDYCSSKFAAFGFHEALRLELKSQNLNIKTTVVCPFYIDTGMFRGVRTRFPRLLPILEPEYTARKILRAIRKNRQRLVMPRFVLMTFAGRLLPTILFDALMNRLGINKSMDEFTGRDLG